MSELDDVKRKIIQEMARELGSDRAELSALYADAGERLRTHNYDEGMRRQDYILLRKAILARIPDIRFNEETGKLQDEDTQRFTLVLDTGNRLVCFPGQGTTPTIFPYPNIKTRVRTADEQLALLRTRGRITDDTLVAEVRRLESVAERFTHRTPR